MPDVQTLVNDFVNQLKKRKIEGSQATAKQTAELLRSVISQQRVPQTNQATALINAVRAVGEKLIAANPVELAVGNIVRRVLHIIREEDLSLATAAIAGLGLSATTVDKGPRGRKLKHDVIEAVNELIQDISTCYEQIAEQAVEHIHQKKK
ncbi:NagB/RpiA transferase-like [Sesbania bispinosa]|nr:NagB/RpiA transferase-like [Sesbania bispinosa]